MANQVNVTLSANRYGKDKVRVFRITKPSTPGGNQTVVEYNVRLLIEGDFETRSAGRAIISLSFDYGNLIFLRSIRKLYPSEQFHGGYNRY